jgi:PQQ-dependent catabolism-associated CXXCW motif protein
VIGPLLAIFLAMSGQADAPLFDPVQGYRLTHYRGVVPAPPDGVTRVTTAQVAALWRSRRALLLDVGPAEGGVRDPATNRWTLAEPHASIPGAHWFPDSGRGTLADGIGPWFLRGVARLHRLRPDAPIIVYCLADCWMSWNAALRLHRAGYRDVRWYAEGMDGWREAGLPAADITPAP